MSTARKKPQDRKKPDAEDVFEFEHGGETYTLPRYGSIKPGLIRRIRKLSDLDATFTILEEVANADALAALDDMSMDEFNQVQRDWLEHSGITLGE
ncbi:MAG TPA: hypothetical protein VFX60_06040 [Micromonospora sp.]|nr:hypothetical protein [Micromonospora sp.]